MAFPWDSPSILIPPNSSGTRSIQFPASPLSHFIFHTFLAASYVRKFMPSTISSPEVLIISVFIGNCIAIEDEAAQPCCFKCLP